eukprot:scaffold1923_cov160-Amphora_coffeaeformis.AAC.8
MPISWLLCRKHRDVGSDYPHNGIGRMGRSSPRQGRRGQSIRKVGHHQGGHCRRGLRRLSSEWYISTERLQQPGNLW